MNWRRFAWLVIALLIVTIVWAAIDLKGMYEKINSAKSGNADDVAQRLASLQNRIASHKARVDSLEKLALWPPEVELMSWLTQQADDADVRIIGVERPPVEEASEYQRVPVKITVNGDYHPLGRFINELERSSNTVRINSFRIRRKEYTPDHITMDLSLSYFQKAERSS
jgi:Tfp pilus assembly protein PilO